MITKAVIKVLVSLCEINNASHIKRNKHMHRLRKHKQFQVQNLINNFKLLK